MQLHRPMLPHCVHESISFILVEWLQDSQRQRREVDNALENRNMLPRRESRSKCSRYHLNKLRDSTRYYIQQMKAEVDPRRAG